MSTRNKRAARASGGPDTIDIAVCMGAIYKEFEALPEVSVQMDATLQLRVSCVMSIQWPDGDCIDYEASALVRPYAEALHATILQTLHRLYHLVDRDACRHA